MNIKTACGDCKTATVRHPYLKEIGEPVVIGTSVGRGHDQTEYRFYQCNQCGSVFVEYEDSGAGGHGKFLKRLTKTFF